MPYDHEAGRADLETFAAQQPDNFWTADPHFQRVLRFRAGADRVEAWSARLTRFGAEAAGAADRAARENDLPQNQPVLERWGPYGERLEAVAHHPAYHEVGRIVYGSGAMAAQGRDGGNLESLAFGYLSALNGEAGHNCPLACTAGVIKTVRRLASPELQERYLPRLLSTDYDTLAHGAQFLTEVQGGSDVGTNDVTAVPVPDAPGTWHIHGEKWFCSNVTADLMLLTARPEGGPAGTRGLGLFLVPRRRPDGSLNAFHIRRHKEKLGTRTLVTAEVDFEGALAFNLGPVEDGFRNMMSLVIDTSRIFNAIATAGTARRACYVAHGYAHHRAAFGQPIARYPLIQETLADMRSETAAAVSGTFALVAAMDRVELGEASDDEAAFLRMGLNLNKLRGAQSAHEVVLSGIEVLGGNGTIETFSPLPRLLRDNVVFENWEGTHNVLLMQVLRDVRRLEVHRGFFSRLREQAGDHPRLAGALDAAEAELERVAGADDALASLGMRSLGARLAWLQWGAAMHEDGTEPEVLAHFLARRLGPPPARDQAYLERIAHVSRAP